MRVLAAVLVAALSGSIAHAQSAPTANDQEAAKAHFMAGSAYYEQANYDDAVKEFNEAYRLSQRPDLLYNIALAYERLQRWEEAIDSLNRYLRDKPEAQDRSIIQTRIENLQKHPVAPPPPPAPIPPAPRKPRHVVSLVIGGIGLGVLAASIGTGVTALQIESDLDAVCQDRVCPSSQKGKVADGKTLSLTTDVLIGVGAAAVVVGVVLLIVESRRPRGHTLWLHPSTGGMAVQF